MARVCKSLVPPEHGYPHRDHRSKKNRSQKGTFYERASSKRFKKSLEVQKQLDNYETGMKRVRWQWKIEE